MPGTQIGTQIDVNPSRTKRNQRVPDGIDSQGFIRSHLFSGPRGPELVLFKYNNALDAIKFRPFAGSHNSLDCAAKRRLIGFIARATANFDSASV